MHIANEQKVLLHLLIFRQKFVEPIAVRLFRRECGIEHEAKSSFDGNSIKGAYYVPTGCHTQRMDIYIIHFLKRE